MAGTSAYIHQSGAVPVMENSIPASTFDQPVTKKTAAIPTNVAGIVLVSAALLILLNMLRFSFVIGLGSN